MSTIIIIIITNTIHTQTVQKGHTDSPEGNAWKTMDGSRARLVFSSHRSADL